MKDEATPISQLKNLGPASASMLATIKVRTLADLKNLGPIACFEQLAENDNKPSLNLLYALLGAVEDTHWTTYKKHKGELLLQLENNRALKQLFE